MDVVIVVLIIVVVIWLSIKSIKNYRKHEVEMELAKHGKTLYSASQSTQTRSRSRKQSSRKQSSKNSSGSGSINKVVQSGANEFKVYGSGNHLCSTLRIKGTLVGWGSDYLIIQKDATLSTYDMYGDVLGKKKLGSSEYVASITMHYFSIGKEGRDRKTKYDKTCSKI